MNISRIAILASVAMLAALGVLHGMRHHGVPFQKAADHEPAANTSSELQNGGSQIVTATPAEDAAASSNPSTDYAIAFRNSANYKDFMLRALPAAQSHDANAAYYLSAAISYCNETNRFFFRRRDRTLTVDQAISERARLPGPDMAEAIRRADARCHDVNTAVNPPWGSADFWLGKAADAGQPIAQIKSAEAVLLAITTKGSAEARKPGSKGDFMTAGDARELARIALESKNPEVIFEMGDLLGLLKPDLPPADYPAQMLTWRYAACLRGLDCSENAEWYFQTCLAEPDCKPGESGLNYLRRTAASVGVFDIEHRATELSEKIESLEWTELGLGG